MAMARPDTSGNAILAAFGSICTIRVVGVLEGVCKAGVQVIAATQNCVIGGVVPMLTWATVNIWIASSFCHITTPRMGVGRIETTRLLL